MALQDFLSSFREDLKSSYMKPSILIFLIFLLCFSTEVLAQKEWRVKASFGASDAALLDKNNFLGGPTYEVSSFYDLGLRAQRKWHPKWGVETGLSYSFAQILISPNWPPGTSLFPINGISLGGVFADFNLLTLPVMASYQLFDFLALQTGPMLSLQLSDSPSNRQSGLGYLIGFCLTHDFEKLGLFVQPNFKRHASVTFEQNYTRLTEFGLQFGVSYRILGGK